MPQSFAAVFVHAVFSTKNREALILDGWREELFSVLGGVTNNLGCRSMIVGGVADHVHLLFGLSRTITIANAIMEIKKSSSAWVNQKYPSAMPFHWQSGYGTFSVSESRLDVVKTYIRNQEAHHKTQTFQDEFREWLQRYGETWDERYVWD